MLQNRQAYILDPHRSARSFAPHFTHYYTCRPAPPQAHILPNAKKQGP